jgi:hypothetical protein
MSTQSMDEVFAVIDAKIAEHVSAMEDHAKQIEALESAKKTLTDNGAAPAAKPEVKPTRARRTKSTEEEVPMVTGKQLYWLDQMGYEGDNPQGLTRRDASAILKELFAAAEVDEDEVEAEEVEEEVKPTRASRTRRNKRNGNGNGNGNAKTTVAVKSDAKVTNDTKKAAILALVAKNMKPAEIAKKLDINVSYVYLVKRDAAKK